MAERVAGIGGIFFRASDPAALRAGCARNGIDPEGNRFELWEPA